ISLLLKLGDSVARGKGLGKTIVLLFLVVILILIGLMWFDYLGVVNAKKYLQINKKINNFALLNQK
ncbi:MAG: hypothetical protein IKB95_07995, partial [Bacteroidales bacterium]|nr:hypothetical protein [Bacteroidales bacterium]